MNYAVEKDSGAMICLPIFIKIDSGTQKFIGRFTDT
jgi:hypothetical protein